MNSWDWVAWAGVAILAFILALIASMIYRGIKDRQLWREAPVEVRACRLLSQRYNESTRETRTVPSVTAGGHIAIGVVTTGDEESHVTVWEVDGIGRMISDDETIWRRAGFITHLKIKQCGGEVRIVGWEEQ